MIHVGRGLGPAEYLPPRGKVPSECEADEGLQSAESQCSNGCLRTLPHISHLLVPRKCQLLLQEKPFAAGAASALRYCYRCVVFVGASIARPPVGYRTGATDGQWPPLQGVLILFVGAIYRSSAISYRQELILAVISRTLFCRVVLPLFSSCSTILMA